MNARGRTQFAPTAKGQRISRSLSLFIEWVSGRINPSQRDGSFGQPEKRLSLATAVLANKKGRQGGPDMNQVLTYR